MARVTNQTALPSQFLTRLRMMAVDEVARGHALLAFGLHFQELEHGTFSEAHQQPTVVNRDLRFSEGRIQRLDRPRCGYAQLFPAKCRVHARPGLKAAHAVPGVSRAAMEIDQAIFLLQ